MIRHASQHGVSGQRMLAGRGTQRLPFESNRPAGSDGKIRHQGAGNDLVGIGIPQINREGAGKIAAIGYSDGDAHQVAHQRVGGGFNVGDCHIVGARRDRVDGE